MAYVRWRSRYVRQSVLDDLTTNLETLNWIGATPHAHLHYPITLSDYFPEEGQYQGNAPEPNTLAVSNGLPGEMLEGELGGGYYIQPYRFNFAFFAESDAIGQSLLQDLSDRYMGHTDAPFISLFDYSASPDPVEIARMEVENFIYAPAPPSVAVQEQHLYYAELVISDYVDRDRVGI